MQQRVANLKHGHSKAHSSYIIARPRYAEKKSSNRLDAFLEVLDVRHPPKDKIGFLIHHWRQDRGSVIYYFDSLENAKAAYDQASGKINVIQILSRAQGLVQIERTQKPWFYDLFY